MFWQFICLTYDIIYDYSPLIMKFKKKACHQNAGASQAR